MATLSTIKHKNQFRHLLISALGAITFGVACAGTYDGNELAFDTVAADNDLMSDGDVASEGDLMSDGEIGTLEQALCENVGGTNTVMTALAVAAGRELRRWSPETDFKWNTSTGRLELSSTGQSRCGGSSAPAGGNACMDTWNPVNTTCAQQESFGNCTASWMGTQCAATCGQCSTTTTVSSSCTDVPPDSKYTCAQQAGWGKCGESWMAGKCDVSCGRCSVGTAGTGGSCRNVQALLDMQKPEANGQVTFPGNIKLDTALLKSKLQAAWNDQMSCNASGSCNVPAHDLRFDHVEDGSCDKKYFFSPLKAGTSTFITSSSASTLVNKLRFVGYPSNKMLNFYMRDGKVSVDPTYGLNEGVTTKSGSCDAACSKFSTGDVSGKCCSCNGATKKYGRSAFNTSFYICQ
jgi:hypothetical protein